jgi:hypothetical protein
MDGGLVVRGAVWEMEVVWPSGAGLRKQSFRLACVGQP